MLDTRLVTFLTLCQTKSFTKTAEKLHITQPAVSHHIKYLEGYYHTKLYTYTNRRADPVPVRQFRSFGFRTYQRTSLLVDFPHKGAAAWRGAVCGGVFSSLFDHCVYGEISGL